MRRELCVKVKAVKNGYTVSFTWYEYEDHMGGSYKSEEWIESSLDGAIGRACTLLGPLNTS